MAIDKNLIDQLLTDYKKPEDIIGENGLLKQLTKAVLKRALEAEMTDHLGYEKHDPAGHHRGNTRNGKSRKNPKGDFGELEPETPRDCKATFELKIVAKGQYGPIWDILTVRGAYGHCCSFQTCSEIVRGGQKDGRCNGCCL